MAYHHGQLRRALLDAALDLVNEAGPRGLTLRGAARRAEVSPSAPYRHFADREALLAALATEGFDALAEELAAIDRAEPDPVERVLRLGAEYVRFATQHRARYRVMFGDEIPDRRAHPELHEASRRVFGYLEGAVDDAHRAGSIAGEPREVTLLCWSMVHGLSSLILDGQARVGDEPAAIRALTERLGRLLLDGVRRS